MFKALDELADLDELTATEAQRSNHRLEKGSTTMAEPSQPLPFPRGFAFQEAAFAETGNESWRFKSRSQS
ncbi:hypothetical protein [Mesorhizobium sp. M0244]|uniref:hypothetical protein n=1 Tax=unclassified Mesorhizobium TaxID=325217 RepID=UPI00333ADCEF